MVEPFPFLASFILVYLIVFVFRNQCLLAIRKALVFSGLRQASPEEYLLLRGWRRVDWGGEYGFCRPDDDGMVYATTAAIALEETRK